MTLLRRGILLLPVGAVSGCDFDGFVKRFSRATSIYWGAF